MEQTEKNVKLLRLLGLIFGLVGAGIMLFSLMMDASVVNSVFGSISVPMTKYLDGVVWVVFLFAACAIAFSLMRWDIPLTVTGSIALAFSVFMIAHISSAGQEGGKYATVSFGAGLIMFFLAAALMLAAGILYIIAKNKAKKAGIPYSYVLDTVFGKKDPAVTAPQETVEGAAEAEDESATAGDVSAVPSAPAAAPSKGKKLGIIIGICVGAVLIIGGGILGTTLYYKAQEQKEATAAVEEFMSSAQSYNIIGINKCLAEKFSDKNDFLAAYRPDQLAESNLSSAGISTDSLSTLSYEIFKDGCAYLGKNYIKGYGIDEVTANSDGSYTAKVKVTMIDPNDVASLFSDKCNNLSADDYEDEINAIMYLASDEEEAVEMLYDLLIPDIADLLKDSVDEAGTVKCELLIDVSKESGEFKVTKIQIAK